jgi:hypothetical protein
MTMRKSLIILLAGIHLLGNTEVGQVMKWPGMFRHYFQHNQLNPGISFFEFIAMHYAGDDGTNADNDIDNKLPCRDISHSSILMVFSPMVGTIVSTDHFFLTIEGKDVFRNSHFPTGFTYSIFQPPRYC